MVKNNNKSKFGLTPTECFDLKFQKIVVSGDLQEWFQYLQHLFQVGKDFLFG